MTAAFRSQANARTAWLTAAFLLCAACSSGPEPSDLPIPTPPTGWASVGAVQADASDGWIISQHDFSGRPVSVHASCVGDGTLFVIVGWSDLSSTAAPARLETAAFPCRAPNEERIATRVELTTAPLGALEVGAFVVEGRSAIGHPTYAVSIEERDP